VTITRPVPGSTIGVDDFGGPVADELNELALFARRPSDSTGITNNTTLQNDTFLFLSVPVASTWQIEGGVYYQSGTGGDFKMAFTGPSGATFDYSVVGLDPGSSGVTGSINRQQLGFGDTVGIGGAGSGVTAGVVGLLIVGATAGTLQLQWAQNTSNGTSTFTRSGSWLIGRRVA
jgi:hypothetical protein